MPFQIMRLEHPSYTEPALVYQLPTPAPGPPPVYQTRPIRNFIRHPNCTIPHRHTLPITRIFLLIISSKATRQQLPSNPKARVRSSTILPLY